MEIENERGGEKGEDFEMERGRLKSEEAFGKWAGEFRVEMAAIREPRRRITER